MKPTLCSIQTWMIALILLVGLAGGSLADSPAGITQHQKDQLKSLASDTRAKTMRVREQIKRVRMDLIQAYMSYDIDKRRVNAAKDKISSQQRNLLNLHLDNEIALRSILNEEQFQAFRQRMMRRMHRPETRVMTPPEGAVMEHMPDKDMLDSLGLSAEQSRKAEKLLHPEPRKMKVIGDLRRDIRQMLDIYSQYDLDVPAARKLIERIHQDQIALLNLQNDRQRLIRQVLTKDQFAQLQQDISRRMAERGGHEGHRVHD